jgi:hypothetical protein
MGSGRINAAKSLEGALIARSVSDGDVVYARETGAYYYINGGKKQPISSFVKNQRFADTPSKNVSVNDLSRFSDGSYAEPKEGTLVKSPLNQTVYYISKGLKLPVTYQVFGMRGFNFANVVTISDTEVTSWLTGSFLSPPEGSLVKTAASPTVYWVVGGVLHPINYGYYISKGLNIFQIQIISSTDFKSYPKGEAYISN